MRKILLAGAVLLCISYPCLAITTSTTTTNAQAKSAAQLKPTAQAKTATSTKSAHHPVSKVQAKATTPSKSIQTTPLSHSNKKQAATNSKIHNATGALKSQPQTKPTPKAKPKPTHKTKPKAQHHQRHSVPQVKPENLTEEDDSIMVPRPMPGAALAATTPPPPAEAPKKHASFFGWFKGNNSSNQTNTNTGSWTNSIEENLTKFAHKTVATLHYSSYKFGGNRFDPQHGVYMLDCSSYVDNMLHQTSPKAYSILAQWSGSYKPNSEHYYNFFNRLSATDEETYHWNKVSNTQKLQAGDILVFRYKNARGRSSGGHVMLVMDKPVGNSEVLQVRVADSAETGHSADTRGNRASGIGIGTLLLKVNPATGQPYAFAWRVNSPWNSRVNIAMGRPPAV